MGALPPVRAGVVAVLSALGALEQWDAYREHCTGCAPCARAGCPTGATVFNLAAGIGLETLREPAAAALRRVARLRSEALRATWAYVQAIARADRDGAPQATLDAAFATMSQAVVAVATHEDALGSIFPADDSPDA